MTPLIVEAEKALTDLAIFKAAELDRVRIEVDLARMRAKKIELDLSNYPNQTGAGEQQRRSEEARMGEMGDCESAHSSHQIVCREGEIATRPSVEKPVSNHGKTGYGASEDSCQVSRPTINPNADVKQAFPFGRW